ncbi:MAG: bifunctional 5,10-methylenetetrahydrofolate dehydrogenase/5,10-methenyltetrahydrofolate cyclohydrolase [Candidatus Micrarchaeia archaeon]
MAAKIIDGKKIAGDVLSGVAAEVKKLPSKPCLALVIVGENPASLIYTKKKAEDCGKVGIESKSVRLPATATEQEIISEVKKLNSDKGVDGIIVQLPLPDGIDEDRILAEVSPEKDADGIHPQNFGNAALGLGALRPCTPQGVIHLLKVSGVSMSGKNAVVIGRSRIVGKPLASLLLNENCTVTVCHSRTKDIASYTKLADIVCVAVGKPRTLTADMVKDGVVVIDIGTTREGERLVGDVDFEAVSKKASFITPVPGGVGPMTRAMLIQNTLLCYKARHK